MRQWRQESIEACEADLAELDDLKADLEIQIDDLQGQIDEIERAIYELETEIENEIEYQYEEGSEQDEWREFDDGQRADDMNATLRDIGGGL
jgi:predicted  nucleic acid-binding Zn-ribbon protein